MIEVVRGLAELRARLRQERGAGRRLGFVPTMGALHRGHLSLVQEALARADHVTVSIFVNPTQFAPHEDFSTYPRTLETDLEALREVGAQLAWVPETQVMYPRGAATTVSVADVSEGLCAVRRPHFFAGVATVVTKLLIAAQPDVAVFGEKDYQQLQVIRRVHADLLLPGVIVGGPTVREADGLAMSSRNAYLTPDQRQIAPMLYRALTDAADAIGKGATAADQLSRATERLLDAGFREVEYLELRHHETLAPVAHGPGRLLAAAHVGDVRLIDNVPVAG